jgi:predicted nucleic acid-binding Zn ribbon protein
MLCSENVMSRLETPSSCAHCGKGYLKYKFDHRFCSEDCRVAAWHQKRDITLSSALERVRELEQRIRDLEALPKPDLFS